VNGKAARWQQMKVGCFAIAVGGGWWLPQLFVALTYPPQALLHLLAGFPCVHAIECVDLFLA
jgi:hypothetical protein